MPSTIDIVTAVIRDNTGLMLVVRKRGTTRFMKPGGKREPGEDDLTALARELDEELGCRLVSATRLGDFEAPAANEPGFTVRAATYLAEVEGAIEARAEIDELAWIDPAAPGARPLAPLMLKVLAALLALEPDLA
ncbi:NUDIX hydrolase [Caulobacter sp. Root655]|uniref:NUDIX hydrolase n=1 Tax=Caulobacter sp. Root655 TaxID=1736578 RepID=UPI0006FF369E|nr:NUDIX domain-containing protein [Caulobacter sp. Root655]KRA58565.1 NUDIX hydrolase [Caulobacter sp. Root655]